MHDEGRQAHRRSPMSLEERGTRSAILQPADAETAFIKFCQTHPNHLCTGDQRHTAAGLLPPLITLFLQFSRTPEGTVARRDH